MTDQWILTWVCFLPLLGALPIVFFPEGKAGLTRLWSLLVTLVTFLLSLHLWFHFDESVAGLQFIQSLSWIPAAGIRYSVGIDGISLLMVLLTTFMMPLAVLSGWNAVSERVRGYHFFLLMLQTGMIGVFIASDLFLFYLFWEAMLIPMYFLIGIWGGGRRIYAAVKFFLFTMAGSVLMLAAILYLVSRHHALSGDWTFDMAALLTTVLSSRAETWVFLAFAFSFAIKVPMFPLHTWLPDAHVEAPTAGSVILAGVLLKMGTYGFLRFCLPFFPDAAHHFTPLIMTLAVIGIIYGALLALVQEDVKKLVAYSSVSHLGFVMLGIFAMNLQGIEGGILQMVNHGLSTGALFLLVGMLYERRHTRLIEDFGGLARVMPLYTLFLLIATFSSIGLPGLNGFIGEFLILLGTFRVAMLPAILAASGVVLGAVYMLWMVQRVLFGPIRHEENRVLKDLTPREWGLLLPVVLLMFWIGLYPKPFLRKMDASVKALVEQVSGEPVAAPHAQDPHTGHTVPEGE
ncbi:MAG: NADH-quinone oxidoreductase subunit M [Candidatus Krumholzibacteria bacterium]|jgi:NADH-quinone oxidoreductase subunit M|nr:NADH-quinone oxidoreductase subunit M [Candidatus Krumholzibacteria bacterium]MDP6796338.1 NADH-quinone oxidoreductase subunit M [Candidatus Krumholzibacteria bacterium]MDP7021024.1 NADH-quinone oxidoreductase subunit M [Candidatus Krumholzibacteria bacterium]